jgi:hypothetical protein
MIDHTTAMWRYAEARSRFDRGAYSQRRPFPLLSAITGRHPRQR